MGVLLDIVLFLLFIVVPVAAICTQVIPLRLDGVTFRDTDLAHAWVLVAQYAVELTAMTSLTNSLVAFTFSASFGCLWTMKRLWGIRVEEHVETAGLDVSEHGMWGYPEFYIPVPGGYGTDSHAHLLGRVHRHPAAEAEAA